VPRTSRRTGRRERRRAAVFLQALENDDLAGQVDALGRRPILIKKTRSTQLVPMDEPKSLDELFTKKIFRIPDYQRGYAWQLEQLKDFWEDLINLSGSRSHALFCVDGASGRASDRRDAGRRVRSYPTRWG